MRARVGSLGLATAILLGLALPLGYAALEYREQADVLSFKAHLNAERVAKYIYGRKQHWQYQSVRLHDVIQLPANASQPVRQRIRDDRGKLVVDTGEEIGGLRLRRDAPIVVDGAVIGQLEAEVSLRPFLGIMGFALLAGLALGSAAYFAFRVLPLRALDGALGELKTQNTRFAAAVNNMPIGLVMFDSAKRVVVCNDRYREIYGLSHVETKPGTHLREMLERRLEAANFEGQDPEQYIEKMLEFVEQRETSTRIVRLGDGRTISIIHHPTDEGWIGTHEDVTDREGLHSEIARQNNLLRAQNFRFDTALNNMSHGLCMFDAQQRLVVCNEKFAQIYGLPSELTMAGTPLHDIVKHRVDQGLYTTDDQPQQLFEAVLQNVPSTRVTELADGRAIVIKHQPMPDGGYVATHEDITEQRRAEAQIAHMAHHDALTDLANRVLLRERLQDALADVAEGGSVAVLCLDLDRFKEVNDTLGHPVGDSLLKAVAARLLGCVRETDTVARIGGDEFAVVQTHARQPQSVTALAERIIEAVTAPYDLHGHQILIGTSVGISVAPNDTTDPGDLIKNADLALYRVKGEGRGTYRFFEPAMDELMHARRKLEADLRKALAEGHLELHYQPILDVENNKITTFEALLRWNHPERGRVSPAEFIPIAEETGLIGPIGEWVLRTACAEAATWPSNVKVAVNLSPLQFSYVDLAQLVSLSLAATGLAADRLELEITESVLLENTAKIVSILHRVNELGVRISMDDFGTGFSSLSNLRSFPFAKIKIDQSFIHALGRDTHSLAIVEAVIGLGARLDMTTTAEGVETEDQLAWLRAMGITEVQGFHIARPMPAGDVRRLLSDREAASEAAA